MNTKDTRAATARVRAFYERLSLADVDRLEELYAPSVYFRDPFNEVRGTAELRRIFARMFDELADCRFEFRESVIDEGGAMLSWDMKFRIRRYRSDSVQTIHGATHLKFDAAGRVAYHRDYWDAAEELYAKLPAIGPVVRWLSRRLGQ